jgi:hypothetical protein
VEVHNSSEKGIPSLAARQDALGAAPSRRPRSALRRRALAILAACAVPPVPFPSS